MRGFIKDQHLIGIISERDSPSNISVVDNVYSREKLSSRGSEVPLHDSKRECKPVINKFRFPEIFGGGKMRCKRNRHFSETTTADDCMLPKFVMKCCTVTISVVALLCAGDTKCAVPSFQISTGTVNIKIRKSVLRRRSPSWSLSRLLVFAIYLLSLSTRTGTLAISTSDAQSWNVDVERMLNNNTTIPSISIPSEMPTIKDTSLRPTVMPSVKPSIVSTSPTLTQSSSPTVTPLPSLMPSPKPSVSLHPSIQPSTRPSTHPSQRPSNVPTESHQPSTVPSQPPSISFQPSNVPSHMHHPSTYPSTRPSSLPSFNPIFSTEPTLNPTFDPTRRPSVQPSQSVQPSTFPTTHPSASPSTNPTITSHPSEYPTFQPTLKPSISVAPSSEPSSFPTVEPTFSNEIVSKSTFIQLFIASTPLEKGTAESERFKDVMVSFTPDITTDDTSRVTTVCEFIDGKFAGGRKLRSRYLQSAALVTYSMEYRSIHTNVTGYTQLFKIWMNNNLDTVVDRLKIADVDVDAAQLAFILGETMAPSATPSAFPSYKPSVYPSREPTTAPSVLPSWKPSVVPSYLPSNGPSTNPSDRPTADPSAAPTMKVTKGGSTTVTIAAVAGTIGAGALIVFVGFCFRRRQRRDANDPNISPLSRLMPRLRSPFRHNESELSSDANGVNINQLVGDHRENASVISDESLISTGSSRDNESDSDVDYNDDTYNLADEFDKYKDQNLEKMRTEVEGMSSNFDGMMSQALTKALMDDMDEDDGGMSVVTSDMANSMEIEATVLCDINDWLKKKEGAAPDEK